MCMLRRPHLVWFALLWFYGISTIVGYVMLNPVFTYIWFFNTFYRYKQINDRTVLFLTVRFSFSASKYYHVYLTVQLKKQLFVYALLNDFNLSVSNNSIYYKLFVFTVKMSNSSIWPIIGPCQVLPLWARVDLGVMAMKRYSAFPKASSLLEHQHQIV